MVKKHIFNHILLLVLLMFIFAPEGFCDLAVTYVGLDKTHIRYSFYGSKNTVLVELKRNDVEFVI